MNKRIRSLVTLYVLAAFFAVLSAGAAEQMRLLAGELDAAWDEGDIKLQIYSRLLIERSALKSYARLDAIAGEQLGMRYPDSIQWVDAS